jgi:enoyl-[acyl-carrier protein] reductase II
VLRTRLCERLGIELPVTVGAELRAAFVEGRGHDYLPFAGQSAALVHEILPAGEIARRVVAEAEAALQRLRFAGAV